MRILHVIESLGLGGAESALLNVVPELVRRGHSCEVAALWAPYDHADELERAGVPVYRLGLAHRWHVWEGMARVAAVARRGQFDVVHSHLFFANLYAALSSFATPGVRQVVTFHNLAYESHPVDRPWRRARRQAEKVLMRRRVDGHLAVSEAVARHFEAHLGLTGIRVVPNALAATPFDWGERPRDRSHLPILDGHEGDYLLVLAGRLASEKGHEVLLDALAILRSEGLAPRCLIVGDGPLRDEIHDRIGALSLRDQVSLCPALPREQLYLVLQAADLCVAPSLHEGFGLVPAEAMSFGTPVVATSVGGLTTLLEPGIGGVLVPPRDPAALADAIARLMRDPAMAEHLGRTGREHVHRRFGSGSVASRLEEFYREVLGGDSAEAAA